VSDASFLVAGVAYASGATATLPPGDHVVFYFVAPDYIPPTKETVTLAPEATATLSRTATFRARIRLRNADGSNSETELIDINKTDIPSGELAKFREIERCDGKRARVLMTDWYDP